MIFRSVCPKCHHVINAHAWVASLPPIAQTWMVCAQCDHRYPGYLSLILPDLPLGKKLAPPEVSSMAPPKKSVTPSLPISLKVPRYTENIFIQRFFFWFLGFLLSLGVWYIGARLVVWHGAWLSPETTQKIVSWLDIPGEKVAPLRTTEGVVLEDVLVKPLPDRAVWDISFTLLNRNNFPVYTPQLSFRLQGAQSVASIAPLPGEPIVGAGSSRNVHIQLPRTQALGERGIPYEMTLVHPNTGNGVGLSDKVKPGE